MSSISDIIIAGRKIGQGHPVFIIAEIGANFSNATEAKSMIRAAADAKADAAKIQTFSAATLSALDAMFTLEDGSRISQYEFFKQHEVSAELHGHLKQYAEELGLIFFSTPSSFEDADFLEQLGVPAFKMGSDDLTNYPFLKYVAQKGLPMIISTGMSTLQEVEKAAAAVKEVGNQNIVFLHCAVGYPAKPEIANLRAIATMRAKLNMNIGFSDHTLGETACVAAVVLGAVMLEKHLTLDRGRGGPDNDVALEPEEFAEMVKAVRTAEKMLGDGEKRVLPEEEKWRESARKSIVAKIDISSDSIITEDVLTIRRPSGGLSPEFWDVVMGKKVKQDIKKGTFITREMLELK